MSFGGIQGLSPPTQTTPELEAWAAQIQSELEKASAAVGISSLTDVTITAAANRDVLMHNGTVWVDVAEASLAIAASQVTTGTFGAGAFTFQGTLAVTGITTLSSDVKVTATKKVFLDGGSNTYIYEVSTDKIEFVAGGVAAFAITSVGAAISTNGKFYLGGFGDTYIEESSDNEISFITGGATELTLTTTGGTFAGTLAVTGNIGFYGQSTTAKPTGVAVSSAGIHAALVTLNLIGA